MESKNELTEELNNKHMIEYCENFWDTIEMVSKSVYPVYKTDYPLGVLKEKYDNLKDIKQKLILTFNVERLFRSIYDDIIKSDDLYDSFFKADLKKLKVKISNEKIIQSIFNIRNGVNYPFPKLNEFIKLSSNILELRELDIPPTSKPISYKQASQTPSGANCLNY